MDTAHISVRARLHRMERIHAGAGPAGRGIAGMHAASRWSETV